MIFFYLKISQGDPVVRLDNQHNGIYFHGEGILFFRSFTILKDSTTNKPVFQCNCEPY